MDYVSFLSICVSSILQIYDDKDVDFPVTVNQKKLPVELNICIQEVKPKVLNSKIHRFFSRFVQFFYLLLCYITLKFLTVVIGVVE